MQRDQASHFRRDRRARPSTQSGSSQSATGLVHVVRALASMAPPRTAPAQSTDGSDEPIGEIWSSPCHTIDIKAHRDRARHDRTERPVTSNSPLSDTTLTLVSTRHLTHQLAHSTGTRRQSKPITSRSRPNVSASHACHFAMHNTRPRYWLPYASRPPPRWHYAHLQRQLHCTVLLSRHWLMCLFCLLPTAFHKPREVKGMCSLKIVN